MDKDESTGLTHFDGDSKLPVDPRKMMGVGALGALAAMALYYVYNMLTDETRERLKEQATHVIKESLSRLAVG